MFSRFRQTISLFNRVVPAALPVSVRRTKLTGLDGYCQRVGDKFHIRINKDLDERMAIETLIHEWAHALRWDYRFDNSEDEEFHKWVHDAAWGVHFAEVYRAYEASLK